MSSKELTMYLEKELDQLKEKGLYNTIDILERENGACIIVDGKKMINLASNNYLGFANREELKKACIEATETYGVGAGAVRTINGSLKIHQQLEEKIAEFQRDRSSNRLSIWIQLQYGRYLCSNDKRRCYLIG